METARIRIRAEARTASSRIQIRHPSQYDLDYLKNWPLALDLTIIIKTAFIVIQDRNAY